MDIIAAMVTSKLVTRLDPALRDLDRARVYAVRLVNGDRIEIEPGTLEFSTRQPMTWSAKGQFTLPAHRIQAFKLQTVTGPLHSVVLFELLDERD